MLAEVIVASITLIGTLTAAVIAYTKSKKIKFFEVYFERKSNAFEELSLAMTVAPVEKKTLDMICTAARKAVLYSTEDTQDILRKIVDISCDFYHDQPNNIDKNGNAFVAIRNDFTKAARKEIENCRNFKFD